MSKDEDPPAEPFMDASQWPENEPDADIAKDSDAPVRPRSRTLMIAALGLIVLAAGYFGIRKTLPYMFADSRTYDIYWRVPDGWEVQPKTAFTLFLYKHPAKGVFIRGFQYHVESDVNVSPGLDAEGLADYYLDTTKENQAAWEGHQVDGIESGDLNMTIIRRETKGKVVYTAFGAKGNTTFGAALYGGGKDAPLVDETVGEFREFLKGFELKPSTGRAQGFEQRDLATSTVP